MATLLPPWTIGQRIKASALNAVNQAIKELQTVYRAEAVGPTQPYLVSLGWTTVTMSPIVGSTYWNVAGNYYTVPVSGTYLMSSKIRCNTPPSLVNWGQGVHSSNIDGAWFVWGQAQPAQYNSISNVRIASFNAGDQLRLYCSANSDFTIATASLVIYRMGD